jgi:CHAD domain-containing protein/CYTH domain-containing protein
MHLPPNLLSRPIPEVVRLVALRYLDQAGAARDRLDDPADSEALHDFRVALRRLRSWLRAFRPEIEGQIRRGTQRRLRRLAAATGESRDLEVQLAWVREQARHPDREVEDAKQPTDPGAAADDGAPPMEPGIEWVLGRIEEKKRDADTRFRRRLERQFPRLEERLGRELGCYRVGVSLEQEIRLPTARETLGPKLEAHSGALATRLAAVHTIADEAQAHETRIAAKRLRYLLEPFASELPGAPPIVEQLKSLQDVLGDLHDAQRFSRELLDAFEAAGAESTRREGERGLGWTAPPDVAPTDPADPRPGILTLGARLKARGEASFARFAEDWLGTPPTDLWSRLDALRLALAESVPPLVRHDGAPAGTRADLEIERKYLLRDLPDDVRGAPATEIRQGWLPGTRIMERLRHSRLDGTVTCYRTIKAGSGITRFEVEEEIPLELFDQLWPHTNGRRLVKLRYRIPAGELVWEIDEFLDRELVLAEVELPGEDSVVRLPDWLAPWVVREVTGEPEYLNRNLAR